MSIFDSLKGFALRKGYALLRNKGATCPSCGDALALPLEMPEVLACGGCAWRGGMMDLAVESAQSDAGEMQVELPADSKLQRSEEGDQVRWLLPAGRKINFLCVFAILWLGFMLLFTGVFLFSDGEVEGEIWVAYTMIPLFWAIGFGMGYAGLRSALMETIIVVDSQKVMVLQKVFGKIKQQELERSAVSAVTRYVAYKQNERPVYGIQIERGSGKPVKFGSRLGKDEKAWLLDQLRDTLEGEPIGAVIAGSQSGHVSEYAGAQQILSYEALSEMDEKGFSLKRVGRDGFRIVRQYQCGKWLLLGSIFVAGVAAFLIYTGLDNFDIGEGDFGFWELFSMMFTVIPLLMGIGFGLFALGLCFAGVHFWGRSERFEFSDGELLHRRGKESSVRGGARYQVGDFRKVQVKESGHVNHEARYKVALVGGKRVTLHGFVSRKIAREIEPWLQVWLG